MQGLLLEILSIFKIFHEHWEPTYATLRVHQYYIMGQCLPVLHYGPVLIFSSQKMFIQKLLDILFVIKIKFCKIKLLSFHLTPVTKGTSTNPLLI